MHRVAGAKGWQELVRSLRYPTHTLRFAPMYVCTYLLHVSTQRPHAASGGIIANLKGRIVPNTGGREYPVDCNMLFNVSSDSGSDSDDRTVAACACVWLAGFKAYSKASRLPTLCSSLQSGHAQHEHKQATLSDSSSLSRPCYQACACHMRIPYP